VFPISSGVMMLPRERVQAALDFRPPDVVPLQVHPSPGGLYEHGRKLLDLIRDLPQDFGDHSRLELPRPGPDEYDTDGRYHTVKRDAWGVTWEYRIFGIWGHPVELPIRDLSALAAYRPPDPPATSGPAWEKERAEAARHRERHYLVGNGDMLWERLHFLRGYEDVLTEIMMDTPEINRLADMVTDYMEGCVRHSLALGADAVQFGDDFGTQQAPIFPPEVWRRFFKPRYAKLTEIIKGAGARVFFHSCGQIAPLLQDFADLGVDAVWPQLPLYDQRDLARRCRDLGIAVLLHPDRGDLMQRASAERVGAYLRDLLEAFRTDQGGSWLYIEVDPGFLWENARALFELARGLRQK
jgi:hypothetical protein